ncbi:hypothetical protein QBC39DRAFT_335873 [Podospora conica]|nr:hypothetical protein QBC39DRAFT_335873 [Schizothecium conicum]
MHRACISVGLCLGTTLISPPESLGVPARPEAHAICTSTTKVANTLLCPIPEPIHILMRENASAGRLVDDGPWWP